ncbi:MAG: helix-turn-helix domain-containing protein, partial [Thiothrix sp.]
NHFLRRAAEELQVEAKSLSVKVTEYLQTLPWPGNVRQLENTCRWLTVMASGREIVMDDLPAELLESDSGKPEIPDNWEKALAQFADYKLSRGASNLLTELNPIFERILLQAALKKTGGRKIEAADLLGWGRNTLTRKLKELEIEEG